MDRQKLFLIFGASIVCAALLSWFVLSQARPKAEALRKVLAAAHDMPAGTRLKKSDLRFVSVPERDVPRTALFDEKTALDRVLLFPVNQNEPVSTTKLTVSGGAEGLAATIEQGKRAVSVQITDATSAGGLIQPRSHVDVLFTRPGAMNEAVTTTVVEDVIVLSVGKLTEAGQTIDPKAARPSSTAATLMVTPEQARKLELARNQGKISLALRNPLDKSTDPDNGAITAEALDPMFADSAMARRRAASRLPNVRDRTVWDQLTAGGDPPKPPKREEKKEPPKPRWVVDVYRGEKHVQEIFQ